MSGSVDGELVCNFKKCRKHLSNFAYVTTCSHMFCDEDGSREFSRSFTCPACGTNLSGKYNIVRVDLQPSEQYKSMVLAGLRPETIMEICSRALSVWTYQSQQERVFQEYRATQAKDRAQQLEQGYDQIVARMESEVNTNKKENTRLKQMNNDLSEKLLEKSRQHQRLQAMYDSMRRKCITPAVFEGSGDASSNGPSSQARSSLQNFTLPLSTGEDILRRDSVSSGSRCTSPNEDFVLRPNATPDLADGSGRNSARRRRPNFTPR